MGNTVRFFLTLSLLFLLSCSGGSEGDSSGGDLFQTKTTSNVFSLELPGNNTYSENQNLDFVLTHAQRVIVSGNPRLVLDIGGVTAYANFLTGSGTRNITFRYTASSSDEDNDGITVSNQIDLNGGTIEYTFNGATEDANINFNVGDTSNILVDTPVTGPLINNLIEPVNATYAEGGILSFQVEFDGSVDISGSPRLALDIGGVTRYANYASGSGSSALVFNYTIIASDDDNNGISLTSSIDLNGGSIIGSSNSENAEIDFSSYLDSLTGVIVNNSSGITAPDQVTNLVTAPSTSDSTLALSWSIPNNNGTAISSYSVQYRELGNTTWINLSPSPTTNSTDINGLSSGVTYEFRVAADNGLLGEFSTTATAEIFNLTSLNLALWLDGSDSTTLFTDDACSINVASDGEAVGCWVDKSGNGHAYVQSNASNQPIFRSAAMNSLSGLEFEGNGDFLVDEDGEAYINGFSAFEFFVVVKSDVTNTDKGILDTKNPNGADDGITLRYDAAGFGGGCSNCLKGGIENSISGSTSAESASNTQSTDPQLVGATWNDGGNFQIYVNGSLSSSWDDGTLSGTTGNAEKFIIGKGPKDTSATSSWDGNIVEIVFLNTQTSAADRTKIMDYLKTKWGIP